MEKVKFGSQEYYNLWAKTMNEDRIMNEANMNEKWSYVFTDKIKEDGTPLTFIAAWDHGKVSVREGNPAESVDFKFKSDYRTWSDVVRGMLNSETARVTGRFIVEGSFSKMMVFYEALRHMGKLAKNLDVEY